MTEVRRFNGDCRFFFFASFSGILNVHLSEEYYRGNATVTLNCRAFENRNRKNEYSSDTPGKTRFEFRANVAAGMIFRTRDSHEPRLFNVQRTVFHVPTRDESLTDFRRIGRIRRLRCTKPSKTSCHTSVCSRKYAPYSGIIT